MNEVAKVDEAESLPVVASPEAQIMQAISAIATNPDADIEKMERLMAMHQSMEDRQSEAQFNAALSIVQGELQPVVARSHNKQTSSNYAKIEAIAKAARPILSANGFSTTFKEIPAKEKGNVRIAGELRHSGGHKETYENEIPLDDKGIKGTANKTGVHAHGSSLTYARRYCLMGMLDISITEDDDGNGGAERLDEGQVQEVRRAFDVHGGDETNFCRMLKVDRLEDIYASKFEEVIGMIERAGQKRRAAQAENGHD